MFYKKLLLPKDLLHVHCITVNAKTLDFAFHMYISTTRPVFLKIVHGNLAFVLFSFTALSNAYVLLQPLVRPDSNNMGGMGQMRGAMQSGLRPGSMIDFTPGFIKASPAGKGHVSRRFCQIL